VSHELESTAERFNNSIQRANLHVGLLFHFGEARLRDAELVGETLLGLTGKLAQLGEEHLRLHFLNAGIGASPAGGGHFVPEFGKLSMTGHQISPSSLSC
jgi:hypothetical protein